MQTEPTRLVPDQIRPNRLLQECRYSTGETDGEFFELCWVLKERRDYVELWSPPSRTDNDDLITAVVVEDPSKPVWWLTLKLWNHYRSPSNSEMGHVFNHLLNRDTSREDLLLAMDEILDLPRSDSWLNLYANIPDLPESIQTKLHQNELDPRHIQYLQSIRDPLRNALIQAVGEGSLSLSVQETRQLSDGARRLSDDQLESIRNELLNELDDSKSAGEVGRSFLKTIREQAYPRTTGRKQDFHEKLDDLDVHGQIDVRPPKNFEGDYLDFRIRCRRNQSLEELSEELKSCQPLLQFV